MKLETLLRLAAVTVAVFAVYYGYKKSKRQILVAKFEEIV
jgi:hypothetical protein